jgi:predicted RecB family nuclease
MFSASEVANFLACHHLLSLDRAEAAGQIKRPYFNDPGVDLLRELGARHEQAYFRHLANDQGLEIVSIPPNVAWPEAVAQTLDALNRGVSIVYQGAFQSGPWRGQSDFLVRVPKPSALGAWSYEPLETKLARSTRAGAIIQLCFYADLLAEVQEVQPQLMHVVLGNVLQPESYAVEQYAAYFRKIKRDFETEYNQLPNTYPEPSDHCDVCSWFPLCDERRHKDDHLSLVAGISRNQRKVLVAQGISTVLGLSKLDVPDRAKFDGIARTALLRIREQARLQVQGRDEGRSVYQLLEPGEADTGLAALPAPSAGDLFLDFEGDPWAFGTGLEYLFGVLKPPEQATEVPSYSATWSLDRAAEKGAFTSFIEDVMDRWHRHPDMHIYHYAAYEPTQMKRMAGQHGVCIDEVDQLLRARIFVDLYRVVKQGLRASVESYSIKHLEPLYGFRRAVSARDAVVALQTFAAALALGDPRDGSEDIRKSIESYNRDDCLSAWQLRDWLEERRGELEARTGKPLPRPEAQRGEPTEELSEKVQRVRELMARLVVGLPADEAEWTGEHRASWLLAQVLEYHRREDKSDWWEYFRQCDLSDAELIEDRSALGGLEYKGPVGYVKRSVVHRYAFPPQDHAVDRARTVHDPKTRKGAGTVVAIDERKGTIDLKRAVDAEVPHPTALIAQNIVDADPQRNSLFRLGTWVAENGISGAGPYAAARDLLLRQRPGTSLADVESILDERGQITDCGRELIGSLCLQPSVLPIQGPPGSGKTFTGGRMIAELVRKYRVGITAVSHKVISKLLQEACNAARAQKIRFRAVQKPDDEGGCTDPMVRQLHDNAAMLQAVTSGRAQVAAGTAWLWARPEMANSVDVLFVDEAGQMSLADVLAVSQAATSIVLLGDPQQLDHPRKGVHPPGVEVSALAHLLEGRLTIDPRQGLFLKETWRLHPDICAFTSELFYDRRLTARPENRKQRLNTRGFLDGTGLRFVPVQHVGNEIESPEEVEKIAALINGLLKSRATWTNKTGRKGLLTLDEILVVAPYNAQVSALARTLPEGAKVGTVDKFQGQEAAVVFYSMTTSTPEDAPRGMEFLYSLNRLNVAVSRAKCVAAIVGSPALFQAVCRTPRQIQLANAHCRYLEMAEACT